MARPFEKINDINNMKELWKIAVSVHHKRSVVSNNKEHFEIIVVDKDRIAIHVVVPTTYHPTFNIMLTVDHTYIILNFKVLANDLVFKPSCHKYMVKFTGGTSVSDVDKHIIPPIINHFTSFVDITGVKNSRSIYPERQCVSSMMMQYQNIMSPILLHLMSQCYIHSYTFCSNNTINYTLWESYACQFIKFIQEQNNSSGPTIVLPQYAKVKEKGYYNF
ncbi:unnamed protein product [Lathyrus oleraceus]